MLMRNMKLYKLKYSPNSCDLDCGPSALSIITGKSVDSCHRRAKKFGWDGWSGTDFFMMQNVLRSFGFDLSSWSLKVKPRTRWSQWHENRTTKQFNTPYLVHIGTHKHTDDHWVVAFKDRGADNRSETLIHISGLEYNWYRQMNVYWAYQIFDKK